MPANPDVRRLNERVEAAREGLKAAVAALLGEPGELVVRTAVLSNIIATLVQLQGEAPDG